jgi:hypothetical protein
MERGLGMSHFTVGVILDNRIPANYHDQEEDEPDYDDWQWEWENFCGCLGDWIQEKFPDEYNLIALGSVAVWNYGEDADIDADEYFRFRDGYEVLYYIDGDGYKTPMEAL